MEGHKDFPRLRTAVFADSVLAQPTLETLIAGGWAVGICTSRASVSGANLRHAARRAGIPVYEASRADLRDNLATWLRELRPDVLVAFTFPYRLPPEVLNAPRLGAFNVHGGKLPAYRGPQPVFWEILNRETEGAATLHRMDENLDHGPIVASRLVPIAPEDTHGLHCVRIAFAAVQLVEVLFGSLLQYDLNLPTMAQDESRACFHRRPAFPDLVIRWEEQSAHEIRALIKAGNPWNQGAFTSVREINLRITDVTLLEGYGFAAKAPGLILTADATNGIVVNCRDGSALQLDVVSMDEGILPGRTLAAYGIQTGERFK